MMNRIKFISGLVLTILIIAGCNETGTWKKQEETMIQNYIKNLGDTAYVLEPSGLYYINLQEGTGRSPVKNDTITFYYKGMFLDRTIFDSNFSTSSPYTAIIGTSDPTYQIIAGLDEGFRYMKEGGYARFLTPSSLAYGPGGIYYYVPGYTPLIWEVILVSVRPGSK